MATLYLHSNSAMKYVRSGQQHKNVTQFQPKNVNRSNRYPAELKINNVNQSWQVYDPMSKTMDL